MPTLFCFNTKKSGFTLIELLVVISILTVLSVIGFAVYGNVQDNAKVTKVRSDMHAIRNAIAILELNTGFSPGKLPIGPCLQNPEVYLNQCAAGLACNLPSTDPNHFPNWQGPYMNPVPKDPWGREYFFDPDYTCRGARGCEKIPNETTVRAIVSAGPDGSYNYEPDDIVLVLCR